MVHGMTNALTFVVNHYGSGPAIANKELTGRLVHLYRSNLDTEAQYVVPIPTCSRSHLGQEIHNPGHGICGCQWYEHLDLAYDCVPSIQ